MKHKRTVEQLEQDIRKNEKRVSELNKTIQDAKDEMKKTILEGGKKEKARKVFIKKVCLEKDEVTRLRSLLCMERTLLEKELSKQFNGSSVISG